MNEKALTNISEVIGTNFTNLKALSLDLSGYRFPTIITVP